MPNSVIVVSQYDSGSEQSWVIGVFSSEEKAYQMTTGIPRCQLEQFEVDKLGTYIKE